MRALRSFATVEQFEDRVGHKPGLPSEWAMLGIYVVEQYPPVVGQWEDYYSHVGEKRHGKIVSFNDDKVVIEDSEDREQYSFAIRHGRAFYRTKI